MITEVLNGFEREAWKIIIEYLKHYRKVFSIIYIAMTFPVSKENVLLKFMTKKNLNKDDVSLPQNWEGQW